MRKPLPALARAILAGLLTVFDVAPFIVLLPLPSSDSSTIASLAAILILVIGASWLAIALAHRRSRILLTVLAAAAALNALTQVVTRALPSAILDRMTLGAIASLFGLDGEYAFDAAGYELWLEIWLFLALIACVVAWAIGHGMQTKTS
jgi:hypothetical protein